jgi:hypothetical protein
MIGIEENAIKITRRWGKSIFWGFWAGLIWSGVRHKLFLLALGISIKCLLQFCGIHQHSTIPGWPKNIILRYTVHYIGIYYLYIKYEKVKNFECSVDRTTKRPIISPLQNRMRLSTWLTTKFNWLKKTNII